MISKNTDSQHPRTDAPQVKEHQLRTFANGIKDSLFILKNIRNRKGQVIDFEFLLSNRSGDELFALPPEDIQGRKLGELILSSHTNGADDTGLIDKYIKVFNTNEILEEEVSLYSTITKGIRVLQRVSPFEDGVILVFQRLTSQEPSPEIQANSANEAYRELAGQLTDAFFALDHQLHCKEWNQTAEKLFARPAQKVLGKSIWEIFPEWRASSIERLYLETLRTKRPQSIVNEYQSKHKKMFLEVSVYPARSGLHIFIKDITQRKQSEEAFKVSKAHLSQILNTVDEVIFSYRVLPQGDFVYDYFSLASQAIWGYTPEELIENKYLLVSCIPLENQESFTQALLEQVLTNEIVTLEYPFRHKDGAIRWIYTKLIPHRASNGTMIITGVAVNITDRKKVVEQIQSTNELLEQRVAERTEALEGLINAIPAPIYVVEQEGMRISYCNTIFAQSLGYESREQVQGKAVFECFSATEAEHFQQHIRQVFEEGQVVHEYETQEMVNGSRHFDVFRVPLRHKNGTTYALLGISHDITELVNARLALSQQTGQLETTNKELEAFSYSVSHDLRAPLRAIDGYTRILLEDYGDKIDEEGRRIVDIITNNAIKMGQLIDDLLDFSRLGRKEIVKLTIDTGNLIDPLISDLKRQVNGRTVTFDMKPLQPSIGDVSMLKQVWINLLSNAVKYSKNKPIALIEVGSQVHENEDVFYVKDNGVGFNMQYSDKLFGVFQRLHSEDEFEGTGVGLAIAQRIVARHGGRIWGEGKPDQGATFYFSLPKKK
ncbi:MAG: PAS domain S-box protein [Bacteroidota bacterium]